MAAARPARRENPLKLNACYHVGEGLVAVLILQNGVELRGARGEHDAAYLNVQFFRFLVVVDRIGLAHLRTDLALAAGEIETLRIVDDCRSGHGLGEGHADALGHGKPFVECVGDLHRALVSARAASGTLLHIDVAWMLQ